MQPSFFKNLGPISINRIRSMIDCNVYNISNDEIFTKLIGINSLEKGALTFINDSKDIVGQIPNDIAIICNDKTAKELNPQCKIIKVRNVQLSVAALSNIFYRNYFNDELDIFNEPKIGKNCSISSSSTLNKGVVLGDNVTVNDGVIINSNCIIGNNSYIDSNSVISNCLIGENVSIGRNTSIGQQGFGFAILNKKNIKIFHIGRVILQENVSIGSNCTIDRGSFSDTKIGENTFFDNLCHVAHNVVVGANCVFAAMTGIAGSARVGNNVLAGGQVGIGGHIEVGNYVRIAAKSAVFESIKDNQEVMGNPAINKFKYLKNYKKLYG